MPLRVGTRASNLATAQAEKVCSLLGDLGVETEIVFISTVGDEKTDLPFMRSGAREYLSGRLMMH